MSLIPYFFDNPFFLRPSRLLDQHFGLGLEPDDLLSNTLNSRLLSRTPAGYMRNWRSNVSQQDSGSLISFDKDKFQAMLDVQQFKPEEISVKVTGDNVVTVEGKHEEQPDEHGFISRHFVRRYVVPKNYDMDKVELKLSSDGVLILSVPTTTSEEVDEKMIPIVQTGEPAKKQATEQQKQ
ncbi:hypothetical protein GWI33_018544 [Rhynchophorus ferrugineus]|uniref:SHSP domain-containing protein n=1 Tax=Rhynchophorus ferrugineus TaxID=354439 RepID=A0A834I725_RHYFE|nr:hypothetical protein GWI33_018544 [Rhynchophorus ferrugineus]